MPKSLKTSFIDPVPLIAFVNAATLIYRGVICVMAPVKNRAAIGELMEIEGQNAGNVLHMVTDLETEFPVKLGPVLIGIGPDSVYSATDSGCFLLVELLDRLLYV